MSRYLLTDFLVLAAFGLAMLWVRRSRKLAAMLPGPRGHGLWLDNSQEVLKSGKPRWVVFDKWKDEYGSIFTVRLGTKAGLVISSAQVAWDLLEKRGDIYSSRPRSIVAGEILSRGFRGIFAPYGDKWRKFRKILNIGLSGKQALTYRAFQTLESAVLLQQILDTPASFLHHVERFAVSTVFSISYGRRIKSIEDPIVKEHTEVINGLVAASRPGRFLVEYIPALLYLPRPLQWFRWEADARFQADLHLFSGHLHEVREKMANDTAKECLSSRVLSVNMPEGYSEEGLAFAASAPYVAGVDTTLATLHVFLLAMVCNPEVMKKAQAELDTVVGRERLPTFQDENILPYCGALIKEVTRWRPIAPLGVAHATTRDDYYNGYFIPEGTTIWPNIYSMVKDEEMFPRAAEFRPERFLDTDDQRMVDFNLPFGFGRRICPGMHVALQSVYIIIVRVLWAFDILPPVDASGKPVVPDPEAFVHGGLVREPVPFGFEIKPRGPDVAKMVDMEALEAETVLKEWE